MNRFFVKAGTVTADPHDADKQRAAQELTQLLTEYLQGLQQRIVEALSEDVTG